jgi:outer membrane receptor protein involved in Fe transport
LILGAICALTAAVARAQTTAVAFHIPAEPIGQALVDFALQAKLSIGDAGLDFGSARGNPVDGAFAPPQALERLLAGTGYEFDFLDGDTVRIRLRGKPADVESPASEIVVVTATKREAVAQDLPYSIVVTTGRELESAGAQTPNDLTAQVAGLTATNLGPGEDKLFVRGLSDSALPGLSESMVGLYLDEARITDDAPDPDLRLIDVDRVEVIRGPQGTLYGAGSLGGLVRIITNTPVFDETQFKLTSSAAATDGGAPSYGFDAMANLPLVSDVLALRAVGYIENEGGYLDDSRLHLHNTNSTGTKGGRLMLAWQPNAAWSVTGAAAYQDIRQADSQYYEAGSPPLDRDNFVLEPQDNRFFQASLTVKGDLGWADLTSASALVVRHLDGRFDATTAWTGLTGLPEGPSTFQSTRGIVSMAEEARLASKGDGPWTWLAGLFVSHRSEDFQSTLTGPDALGAPLVAETEHRTDHADDLALFGEASFAFTPQITLTAGGRVFVADRSVAARGMATIPGGSFTFTDAHDQTGATPKLVLSYRPADSMMFYGQISEGYRLGGFNVDGPAGATHDPGDPGEKTFDSDSLWNYELGAKTSFWNGRIVANAAAYLAIWNNVQSDQVRPDGTFFIVNAGTVHDLGFETDVTVAPLEGLSLQGNLFMNNTQLIDPNPLLVKSDGVLPGAPDISFGVSGRYDLPWKSFADTFVAFDYSYVGRSNINFDEVNSPTMGGYHLTNARIGFARGPWQLVIFADNIANERKNTFAFGNPFDFATTNQITPPRPRTIGLSLSWSQL